MLMLISIVMAAIRRREELITMTLILQLSIIIAREEDAGAMAGKGIVEGREPEKVMVTLMQLMMVTACIVVAAAAEHSSPLPSPPPLVGRVRDAATTP